MNSPDYGDYASLKIPPLAPNEALETFELEDGFRIELVAHEPDVVNPVAMDIDADGRLWVVEMRSYMPVHNKSAEETSEMEQVPESRIVVLEDTTGDGQIDHNWVFMDSLVLPRSIKVLDDGVLIAEPPNTWFIQDTTGDGIGDTKELVFNRYGDPESDNVEHMDNGLMWGMDNWIYSVYSDVSLRRVNGGWQTRPFEQMTQWGITQDDWGRLYSTHNSRTLVSHLVPYSYSHRHPKFSLEAGINSSIAESETMWPAHPTGVNRGYRINEIVREDGTLKRSTATCGPVIYRGDQFGEAYRGNAFVPEPAGNLIKRLVNLDKDPEAITAEAQFAYEGREFLTSTDERFRPVNLYNGPDGAIYVVDMYQGIFQHAHYLTDHLRDYAVEHDLHKPAGDSKFGRIYRIVRDDRPIDYDTPNLTQSAPEQLLQFLSHKNGKLRDAAQQLLVQRSPKEVIPQLENLVRNQQKVFYTRLQALWTLEGYDRNIYKPDALYTIATDALQDTHSRIRAAAVRILEQGVRSNPEVSNSLVKTAKNEDAPYTQLQLLATLGATNGSEQNEAMADILNRNLDSVYFREKFLTGVHGKESDMLALLKTAYSWDGTDDKNKKWILERLRDAENNNETDSPTLAGEELRLYKLGEQQFRNCMACHGNQGGGIEGVAPALSGSRWVNREDPAALTSILLKGYTNRDTEFAGVMPSHSYLTDEEVAAVLTYIRQSWENDAPPVAIETVSSIRKATEEHSGEWTKEELQKLQN
ncbi:c-type cytochrome [Aliifodinibius sp. S!AR15-10]|uniref:DUF7133 domain-containing protein n=1 Tax=Aliifodinibius sp. S!AR15-10 TaxID=2950437 RepID=UPI002866EC4D|nr:c-type cytochrome [Aliifodinibius sp. S!AR15-10]MDR8393432.1 c-type cytochrome [Aliifodinibius sp. S!AR15-10]